MADAIAGGLDSTADWRARRAAALAYARRFDWQTLLGDVVSDLGF